MQEPRTPAFRFTDEHRKEFRIDLDFVPERLVVICWDDVGPVAGGGTGGKPPKRVEFETKPKAPVEWPPSE
jgi:hypothetical protein